MSGRHHARLVQLVLHPVEGGILDYSSPFQMLDDDALEQFRSHTRVPDSFGIDHHDRTSSAHAEAWRLTAFYPAGAEQEIFALKQ